MKARDIVGRTITGVEHARIGPKDDPAGNGFTAVTSLTLDNGAKLIVFAHEREDNGPIGDLLLRRPALSQDEQARRQILRERIRNQQPPTWRTA